jgi:hypothetical protein
MRIPSSIKAISALALISALAASLTLAGNPNPSGVIPGVSAPGSTAYGKTLTEWMGIYFAWYYGTGADPAQAKVGPVQLMPLPNGTNTSGSWTPDDPAVLVGELEITLPQGTPFVLPLSAWIRERYEGWPTVPDDPLMSDAVALDSAQPTLTIDGKTVLTDANKAAFYVPATDFDPIVVYPAPSSYGSVAALSYQGIGMVIGPLTPGTHVIHLYEPVIFQVGDYAGLPNGLGMVYDNTWFITVQPGR